jgi:plastocyanin
VQHRRISLALLSVATAAVLVVPSVAAQSAPVAADGASLADQSAATQSQFQATWGSQAASQWVTEHNLAIGGMAPAPITIGAPAPGPSLGLLIDMNDKDQFAPQSLTIPRGASVTWTNSDTDEHTVTADPAKAFPGVKPTLPAGAAAFDSGDVAPGATYLHKFDVSGHYIYFCAIHAAEGMVGTIDVT